MTLRTGKYQPRHLRRQARHEYRKVLIGLTVLAIFIFLKVWQKVNVDHQYRYNGKLQKQLLALEGENSLLEAHIEELKSMERLGELAQKQMNLVPVPVIKLQEKGVLDKLTKKLEKWQR